MNRLLFIVIVFLVLVPFVWTVVRWLFAKIDSKVKSRGVDVDYLNAQRNELIEDIGCQQRRARQTQRDLESALKKLK